MERGLAMSLLRSLSRRVIGHPPVSISHNCASRSLVGDMDSRVGEGCWPSVLKGRVL